MDVILPNHSMEGELSMYDKCVAILQGRANTGIFGNLSKEYAQAWLSKYWFNLTDEQVKEVFGFDL